MIETSEWPALGIDAGGTYTDAVVYDVQAGRLVAKAKALTTRPDPTDGISAALDTLGFDRWRQLAFVALSTTFATNAIVEQRYARAGLILLGYPDFLVEQITFQPTQTAAGRIDVEGTEQHPLDEPALSAAAEHMLDEGVSALAVSGMYSVVNPAHELRAGELLAQRFAVPVVQGHHLSMALNAVARAVTARLNAGLLPLIDQLIAGVEHVLAGYKITAPLCLVKGDGTLVSAGYGRTRPVELIMSGPAASVAGGRYLLERQSGKAIDDAVIVDVGGTTTDIGMIRAGQVDIAAKGARVGDFQTHVEAIDVRTVGLGGDSVVHMDTSGHLVLGPRRVMPIGYLADRHPAVASRLAALDAETTTSVLYSPADFFLLLKPADTTRLADAQRRIIDTLKEGPVDRVELSRRTNRPYPSLLPITPLEDQGTVIRSAPTPTDAWTVLGQLALWPAGPAETALRLCGRPHNLEPHTLAERILQKMHLMLGREILLAAWTADASRPDAYDDDTLGTFIDAIFRNRQPGVIRPDLRLAVPVVLLGGPAESLCPAVRDILEAQVDTVDHAEVANAIGTVVGHVVIRLAGEITGDPQGRYLVHLADGQFTFDDLDSAKTFARQHLERTALDQLDRAGGTHAQVSVDLEDHYGEIAGTTGPDRLYLRTTIHARATGKPVT